MKRVGPLCDCGEKTVVFTCPECCGLALRFVDEALEEALAQRGLFDEVDSRVSVSASERRGESREHDQESCTEPGQGRGSLERFSGGGCWSEGDAYPEGV